MGNLALCFSDVSSSCVGVNVFTHNGDTIIAGFIGFTMILLQWSLLKKIYEGFTGMTRIFFYFQCLQVD
jgi:hypothetical protein